MSTLGLHEVRFKALLSAILSRGSQSAWSTLSVASFCTERGLRTVCSRLQTRGHPIYRGTGALVNKPAVGGSQGILVNIIKM